VDGFASGVFRGRFPSSGKLVMAHGIESIVPQGRELDFAKRILSERGATITNNRSSMGLLGVIVPQTLNPREVGRMAAHEFSRHGIPMDEGGVASSIEALMGRYLQSYGQTVGYGTR